MGAADIGQIHMMCIGIISMQHSLKEWRPGGILQLFCLAGQLLASGPTWAAESPQPASSLSGLVAVRSSSPHPMLASGQPVPSDADFLRVNTITRREIPAEWSTTWARNPSKAHVRQAALWGGFADSSRFLHRRPLAPVAQGDERVDSLHAYDALRYDASLWLSFGPPAHLQASMTIDLVAREALDALQLHLRGYTVADVCLNGQATPFTREADRLLLDLAGHALAPGDSARLVLHYAGPPVWENGLGLSVSPQIAYTLSDPWGTRNWLPCFDEPHDKALWSVSVRADSTFATLANGELLGITHHGDGTSTWAYRHDVPMSSYLVSFACGRLTILEDNWNGLPMRWFVYPQHVAPAWQAVSRMDQMLACFTSLWGGYPFSSYAMGEAPIYGGMGGMEHQTCTTIGSGIIAAGLQYESIIAHELSHMWWGDSVTPVDFRHVWLNEGWATYAEAYFYQHLAGGSADAFLEYLRLIQQTYLNWDTQFQPIHAPPPNNLFTINQYEKAASVLHMLRDLMGEVAFHQAQRDWLAAHRHGTVDAREYQEAMEAASGLDLDWFFQQWIYRGGYPTYHTVTEQREEGDFCRIHLTVNQSHQVQESFRARLPIRLLTSAALLDTFVWIEDPSTQHSWLLPGVFDTLLFNHRETVLCRHVTVPPQPGPPLWQVRSFTMDDSEGGNGDGDLAPGDWAWLSLTVENVGGWDTDIQFSLGSSTLDVAGAWEPVPEAGGGTVVTLPTGHVQISGWNQSGMAYADLVLHSTSFGHTAQTSSFRLPMGDPWLLLAMPGSQMNLLPYYEDSLDSLRVFTDHLRVDLDPLPPPGLPDHSALLWFTGAGGQVLEADQQSYLRGIHTLAQGTVFVSGQDAWDQPAAECLFQPLSTNVADVVVDGLPGTVFEGLSALLIGAGGAGNQVGRSSLQACEGVEYSVPLAVYRNSQEAAILGAAHWDMEMTLFACGFGLEAISGMANTNSRQEWMGAVVELLQPGTPLPPRASGQRAPAFTLGMPHPNPFNPMARIPYTLHRSTNLLITLHDVAGREVAVLHRGEVSAGSHTLRVDGRGLASGLYFLALEDGTEEAVRKLLLIK